MDNAGGRRADYDAIIANPLFKAGYDEIFRGEDCASDIRWSDGEQEAYERGRQFGQLVRLQEGARIPLKSGTLAHPRAKLLLMLAMRDGDVQ